nr:acyltransferase family protein [uncultured Porphyromonas sp.]
MQVTPSSERLSQLVSAARFPLMILVVLIHVPLPEHAIPALPLDLPLSASAWYFYASRIISFGIGAMAVPMFFLFSGYYMFFKQKAWNDASVYLGEMRKRLKGLVIPYFIWCSLALISHLLLEAPGSGGVQGLSLDPQRLLHAYLFEPANFPYGTCET